MAQSGLTDTALRVSGLSTTTPNAFCLRPSKDVLEQIARDLSLSALRKLSFEGHITARGKADWEMTARLGATVTQACVVTLDPVITRIDIDVRRLFVTDFHVPDETEVEMPEDDSIEPLTAWIDPAAVMQEALALAVPDYPRQDAAELGQMVYTKPGETPMTDQDARPFASLADFKRKLEDEGS
ncbi:MAG: DUF177 domain-containing protein [Pseudomonadota bacterium]